MSLPLGGKKTKKIFFIMMFLPLVIGTGIALVYSASTGKFWVADALKPGIYYPAIVFSILLYAVWLKVAWTEVARLWKEETLKAYVFMPSSFILIVGFCCFLIVQALPNVMHLFSPNELSSFKAKVVYIDKSIGSYNGERVSGCDKKLTVNSKDYGRVQLCAIKVSLLKLFRKGDTVVIEGKKSFWGFSISGWSFDKKILERAANQ